jgi:hypothetical protein
MLINEIRQNKPNICLLGKSGKPNSKNKEGRNIAFIKVE